MKTIRIIVVTGALLISAAHANLIDLTPGGFDPTQGLPPPFFQLQSQLFFDEAAHGYFNLPGGTQYLNGWVSQFGALNGGTYFFTNLFSLGDTANASVSWNFAGEPSGSWLTMILVEGRLANGTVIDNIYGAPFSERYFSPDQLVLADGNAIIFGISFFGWNATLPVPDEANAGTLFVLAIGALLLTYKAQRRRNA